jgi:hypothetical protein
MGNHKGKKKASTTPRKERIAQRKRLEILSSFGTIDFDPKYDYKAERKREALGVRSRRHRYHSTPPSALNARS